METALAENSHLETDACVAENSRLEFRDVFAGMYPAIDEVEPNNASGIDDEVRREGIRSRSTGKERDQETGFDHFEFRYLSGVHGRFTSPDPENTGVRLADPQTWNAYSYVRNLPVRLVDPHGLDTCYLDGVETNCGQVFSFVSSGAAVQPSHRDGNAYFDDGYSYFRLRDEFFYRRDKYLCRRLNRCGLSSLWEE